MENVGKKGKQPDWIAFSVIGEQGEKSRWREIGVGFDNKSDSITVLLDAAPLAGRMVLMRPKEQPVQEQSRQGFVHEDVAQAQQKPPERGYRRY